MTPSEQAYVGALREQIAFKDAEIGNLRAQLQQGLVAHQQLQGAHRATVAQAKVMQRALQLLASDGSWAAKKCIVQGSARSLVDVAEAAWIATEHATARDFVLAAVAEVNRVGQQAVQQQGQSAQMAPAPSRIIVPG